jgi:cellulose synthase/poly-beta-1,6-N-acetylglucosamine synthase-like glycosyltransferase
MIIITFCILTIYLLIIISFIIGFNKVNLFKSEKIEPKNTFTIVVPFRNEANNLPQLLTSLQHISYPAHLFEIIFVNDASKDHSTLIIETFKNKNPFLNVVLLNNQRKTLAPKKDAINTAISKATFEWIITTDADCEVLKTWLQTFNEFIETKKPYFISAPVKFLSKNSLLNNFQNLNILSLIGATVGSFGLKKPIMCNGANLCYNKEVFNKLNGFEGNLTIASGDDVFLLEKMAKKHPAKTLFLKSEKALVTTKAEKNWKLFINQQIRWASKASASKNYFSKLVGIVVFLVNTCLVSLTILSFINFKNWFYLIFLFLLKIVVDFILIKKTAFFLQHKISIKFYVLSSVIYPFFTTIIAVLSLFYNYEWKGRTFKI